MQRRSGSWSSRRSSVEERDNARGHRHLDRRPDVRSQKSGTPSPPAGAQHPRRHDWHDAAVRSSGLDVRRAELHRQSAQAQDHDPAGSGDRHHRCRRHAGHHYGRHRSVVGVGRRHDRDDRSQPRTGRWLHPRDLPQPHWPQPDLSGGCGSGLWADRRPHQWVVDRLHENPGVHRHARHDGVGPRRRRLVHERPADRQSFRELRGYWSRLVAGDYLSRSRLHLSHCAALYALRQVHLRHRRQSSLPPAFQASTSNAI